MFNLMHGDCLERMKEIPDGSVDMILADVPYGTTACKWDSIIPLEPMWEHLKRIIKPDGAIALFGTEPFSSALRMSNIKEYKYDWVWDKKKPGAIGIAKFQPLRYTENISIFNCHYNNYNPQMVIRDIVKSSKNYKKSESGGGGLCVMRGSVTYKNKYPKNIIEISNASQKGKVHPTQKPVALMEYLIKTYTNEGETVLDFTMGSGTTGVACAQTGRKFIGIEMDDKYFEIAKNRIEDSHKVLDK
jgi:DNA modification methylase